MLVFIVFLLIFTLTSNRWCFNSDLYWFGRGLTNQLVEIEYDEPKLHTYKDITTLGDLKEYLNGTFADFVFTHNDATPQGYNHFLGPVRVAQLRCGGARVKAHAQHTRTAEQTREEGAGAWASRGDGASGRHDLLLVR